MRDLAVETFSSFVREIEPRLRRALIGAVGVDAVPDAVAEALAYAWENWSRVSGMDNPAGYLYRVGQSSARKRRVPFLPPPDPEVIPEVEPGLIGALAELSPRQRRAIWLVHGCGWTYRETAEALDISASAVGTHISRGMKKLRDRLELTSHALD